MTENRQILIDSLPKDKLEIGNYRLESGPIPEPADGQVQARTLALTVAAGTRAGLQGSASYAGAPKSGIVMNGTAVARITASRAADLEEGQLVVCQAGWQDYSTHDAKAVTVIDPKDVDAVGDIAQFLSALGTNGLTAYFGLLNVGKPQAGETVLVSAAAGSVGHIVGQLAKIKGARVVGVAGSDEKCALLQNDLGFDAAVNYKDGGLRDNLRAACSDGVDVYFDNTGGPVLGTALFNMNVGGRIACCGVVSQYDTANPAPGPKGIPGLLVNKRLIMQGFLVFDFASQYEVARGELKAWLASGELKSLHDNFEGLAEAPRALVDLLAGGNVGTRIVRVAD